MQIITSRASQEMPIHNCTTLVKHTIFAAATQHPSQPQTPLPHCFAPSGVCSALPQLAVQLFRQAWTSTSARVDCDCLTRCCEPVLLNFTPSHTHYGTLTAVLAQLAELRPASSLHLPPVARPGRPTGEVDPEVVTTGRPKLSQHEPSAMRFETHTPVSRG